MSRNDCLDWMKSNGYPKPPRSACVYCPYHSNHEWYRLKTEQPNDFLEAVQFERSMQEVRQKDETAKGEMFLHKSCIPLDQIPFEELLKNKKKEINDFENECVGMCGV